MYEWRVWRILLPTFPFLLPFIFPDPPFYFSSRGGYPLYNSQTENKTNMTDTQKETTFTATAGLGTRSGRHLGGVDPAPLGSSSNKGPTTGLTTGPVENITTAANMRESEERERSRGEFLPNKMEFIGADASNTPLPQREPRKGKSTTQPEASTSWVRMAEEEEDMEVEMLTGRNLKRIMSQESISSRQSMQTIKMGTDDEPDSSGNEARSTISMASGASGRSIAKATKRKRSTTRTQAGKRSKDKEILIGSDDEEGYITPSKAIPIGMEDSLKAKSFEELAETAFTWLQDIDINRRKCSNIKGPIHKVFKDRTMWLEELIRCLVDKGASTGDPVLYKMRLREVTGKLKAKEKEENKLKEEKRDLEREVENLYKKVEELEMSVHQLSRGQNPDPQKVQQDSEYYLTTYPALRPALKGERKLLTMEANLPVVRRDPNDDSGVRPRRHNPGPGPGDGAGPGPSGRGSGPGPDSHPGPDVVSSFDDGPGPRVPKTKEREIRTQEDEEVEKIKQQIRQLTIRKKEIYKVKKEQDRKEETGNKAKIKVLSNVQVRPPIEQQHRKEEYKEGTRKIGEEGWVTVNRKGKKQQEKGTKTSLKQKQKTNAPPVNGNKGPMAIRLRKVPKTAAVSLRSTRENISYADILRKARTEISLKEMGIEESRIKKGIDGAVIIEIPGPEGQTKANQLATQLRQVLSEDGVQIARPCIKAEMRIWGFDDSVSVEEIRSTIVEQTNCLATEIKVGNIRRMYNGLSSVWIQCPAQAANHLVQEGKLRLGWTIAKIELLKKRPLQCYKCWGHGHVKLTCTAGIDRSSMCYFCGVEGHMAKTCSAVTPNCVICQDKKLPAQHRVGAKNCSVAQSPPLKNAQLPRNMALRKAPDRRTADTMEVDVTEHAI